MNTSKELATQEPSSKPLATLSAVEFRNNRQVLLQVMEQEMKPGVDYGITPGTDKPALWKPGAEKLVSMFSFAPSFTHECERQEDRHRTYTIKCKLEHRGSGTFLGDADAVCSTMETKYVKRKDGTPTSPPDFYNTCMKMGEKRALIAVVLFVTAASDIFTQDLDDDEGNGHGANGGATSPQGGLSRRGRGTDTTKAEAGLWTGVLGVVSVKTYKDNNGKQQEYFILALKDGRSASTFDTAIAEAATKAKDLTVKIGTKAGKKAGFFNIDTFEVLGKPEPKAEEKPKETAKGNQAPDPDEENPFN